jgi:glycosyltransferase involved in cell wall biosynthesis
MSLNLSLLIVFILVVSIQIIFYGSFFFAFATKKKEKKKKKNIALSVIVCAKNEAKNLKENLPSLLNQNHPNFEVVLVNDGSTDDSLEVMTSFKTSHPNVKVVDVKSIEAFWGNKKYALTLGIKAATNDFLVFTDADCKPNSQNWLSTLSSEFSNEKSIVLGYGGYAKKKSSLLNQLIRFETVFTALQYFSYTLLGQPYMGVGRNLAYRKELFFNNSGFSSHMSLMSGDDDLFINAIATSTNTAVSLDQESFTISKPKTTFRSWFLQKRRHVSTATFYKTRHKLLLSVFYSSQLLFWLLIPVSLIFIENTQLVVSLIALRFTVQLAAFWYAAKTFKELNLIVLAPLLELILVIFQLVIFIANLISKPGHWK